MEFSEIISWFGDEFDLQLITTNLIHLVIAFIFALPVAWNRERTTRSAGLRTFPLVSIASCAYMLIGISIFETGDAVARVTYGIVTGMGFIGGGAILKSKGNVMGTATAASIWNTGAIGVSVAFKLYEIGILLAIINFLILWLADPLKKPEEEKSVTQDDVGAHKNNNQ